MDSDSYIEDIKRKWDNLHEKVEAFAYKLDVKKYMILKGKYGIYCELNPERTTKRRIPQQISLKNTTFDHNKFNFTRVKPEEIVLEIPFEESIISFIINTSPLTKFHSLVVPDVDQCYPQILSKAAIRFTASFLLHITDHSFKIGFNSPGALASVNHLHLHLVRLHQKTFIENIELVKLNTHSEFYKSSNEDIQFVCVKVCPNNFDEITKKLHELTKWMVESLIPHNLYFLRDSNFVKVFVFAKKEPVIVKTLGQVNLAFCELIGYVPVGDEDIYDGLKESFLISSYNDASGDIYEKLYNFIEQ